MYISTFQLTQKSPFPISDEARDVPTVLLEHEVHLEPIVCPASKFHLTILKDCHVVT